MRMLHFIKKYSNSEAGFSLLEAVAAGGILVVVGAASTQLLLNGLKSGKAAGIRSDFIALSSNIEVALGKSSFCVGALKNSKEIPSAPFFNPGGTVPFEDSLNSIILGNSVLINRQGGQGGLTVSNLSLSEVDPARREAQINGIKYLAKLNVTIENTTKLGAPSYSRDYYLSVTTTTVSGPTEHQIASCSLLPERTVATTPETPQASSDIIPAFKIGMVAGLVPQFVDRDTITITPGSIYSDDGLEAITIGSTLTVERLGLGLNGMDLFTSNTPSANGWISIWVIKNPVTNQTGGLLSYTIFSGIPADPVLPAGFTKKRRIGWIPYSSSGSQFKQFAVIGSQLPRLILADDLVTLGGLTSKITNGINNINASVPPRIKYTLSRLQTHCDDSNGGSENPTITAKATSSSTLSVSIFQECNAAEGQLDSITEPLLININNIGHREVYLTNNSEGWEQFQIRGWYDSLD